MKLGPFEKITFFVPDPLSLLAVGRHIRRRSLLLSSSTPAAATHASSSAGAAVSSGGGSRLLVDLYSSGPNTNEDAGEFGCRNFIMNPELAMAAMDKENNDGNEQVFQDVLMKTAITHRLKRQSSSRDLSFTIIELTNMIQSLIDNCCEIIEFTVLFDRGHPSHTKPFAPCLEQALLAKLSKKKVLKEEMADTLAEIYFLWKDIAHCPDMASTLPHERTKLGSALSEFTVALVRVHPFCKAELEAERNTRNTLNCERISGEK